MRADAKGLAGLTRSARSMWETLIEACCRAHDLGQALRVFDDWKAASLDLVGALLEAVLWLGS